MENLTGISEDEQNVDNELEGHGCVEPGMSLEDKKSLLAVLKMSESTALAEEHSRVGLQNSSPRTQLLQDDTKTVDNLFVQEQEVATLDLPTEDVSSAKLYTVTNLSNDSDSEESDSSKASKLSYSSPKFTPKTSRLSLKSRIIAVDDEKCDENRQFTSNVPEVRSSQSQDLLETEGNPESDNKGEETFYLKNDQPQRRLVPKEDRKRNINVFNLEEDNNSQPLMVGKQRKVMGKAPYYFVPHGMSLKDFTVYFKQQLDMIGKNLVLTQRKSLNFVPWGDPVVVGKVERNCDTFKGICGEDDNDNDDTATAVSQNQRYNFRGRSNANKRKCEDDIFSYISEDSSSVDDSIFSKKVSKESATMKTNPYKGVAKRKPIIGALGDNLEESDINLFTEDKSNFNIARSTARHMDSSSDNEQLENDKDYDKITRSNSGVLKKKQANASNSHEYEKLHTDGSDDDIEAENYIPGKRIQIPKTKLSYTNSKRKKVSKPVTKAGNKGEMQVAAKANASLWLNTTSIGEPQEDKSVIKPMPVKMRKLARPNSKFFKSLNSHEIDEIIVPDDSEEQNKSREVIVGIACPICKKMFHGNEIQDHASECTGFEDDKADILVENAESLTSCPICLDHFPIGPNFDRHAQNCKVTRRLVHPPPPTGRAFRNQNKR